MRPRLLDLLPAKVAGLIVTGDACWTWSGWHNSDGYAYVTLGRRSVGVHRLVLQASGVDLSVLEVDHLCRNRACVNPDHLEAVTHAENQRRLSLAQTSCRRAGHDWTDPRNVYVRKNGRRCCAECARISAKEKWHAPKVA